MTCRGPGPGFSWVALLCALLAGGCANEPSAPKQRSEGRASVTMGAPQHPETPPRRARPSLLDGPGVTFFVAADTHFGYEGLEPWNLRKVRAMNELPGTPYPRALGGRVRRPLGVLVAGDLTNRGRRSEWKQFVRHYGLKGGDGMLRYPVFEGTGNHDYDGKRRVVAAAVRRRHGGLSYGWSWQGVHFLCLDTHPRIGERHWLRKRLRRIGKLAPVVVYFHYSIIGPYSSWWSDLSKQAFRRSVEGYNVIAVFHGHFHHSERYRWQGLDVYNVGSPMHSSPSFGVATVTAGHLTVAAWNYQRRRWDWHHQKRISRGGATPGRAPASGQPRR